MAAALTGPHTVPGEPWPTTLSLLLLLFLLPPTQVVATAHRHPASEEVAFSRDVACGQRPVQGKILGGVDALERKWPWQVSVHYTGFHICGGSIVDEYWILSAAHCFDRSMNTEAYDIYVGLVDLLVAGNHTQWFEVNKVIIHPTYGLYHPIGGDVALVQLKTRIVFSDAVLPVCIAPPDLTLANLSCWATGWGSISQEVSEDWNLYPSINHDMFLCQCGVVLYSWPALFYTENNWSSSCRHRHWWHHLGELILSHGHWC
ncbi:hypothetical protein FD755_000477 [Muntiacus reevesi]|uniref:Peptidase S1 domain-containing protein n=1 Tax=Muntiacus reevesi TaxID=9886 RepID=A0A5J5MYW6_MUNRE|nr:hypothetical protein FD755_000477 [Muntiacus reevesi]